MRYLLILLTLFTVSCSQKQVTTHMGTGAGAATGFMTCRELLQTNYHLTAACTLAGAMFGSSVFYKNDMNIHTAVFVDTLNTAPGHRSHTNWGNGVSGNWGSITINRTYVTEGQKCKEYESVISITTRWPLSGVHRENEFGTACQMPDGRWVLQ